MSSGPTDAKDVKESREHAINTIINYIDAIESETCGINLRSLSDLRTQAVYFKKSYLETYNTVSLHGMLRKMYLSTSKLHEIFRNHRDDKCYEKTGKIKDSIDIINKFDAGVYNHNGGGDGEECQIPTKFGVKYVDHLGNLKTFVSNHNQITRKYTFTPGNSKEYDIEDLLSEISGRCDPSTTEVTITVPGPHVKVIKVHARTAFLNELSPTEETQQTGGSTRKKKGSKKAKGQQAPKAAPRWTSTGRKVTTKDGRSRVAFRNAAGELRVRKVTVGKDGKRTTRYISF